MLGKLPSALTPDQEIALRVLQALLDQQYGV